MGNKNSNNKDIAIKLEDGHNTIIYGQQYGNFKKGNVKSPFDKTVYEGYLGKGEYKTSNDNYPKGTIAYRHWVNMLIRCYDKKYKEKRNTYKDAICCEDWLNFQTFSKWHDENYYEINNEEMGLDKDILIKGNKIYNSNNCVFVPQRINKLFVKNDTNRGELPIGVIYNKNNNNYRARYNAIDKRVDVGSFNNPTKAFYAYKQEKEKYIKVIADEYKDKIPLKLYQAMYKWEVKIDD